jgi:hypothetical protein
MAALICTAPKRSVDIAMMKPSQPCAVQARYVLCPGKLSQPESPVDMAKARHFKLKT